MKIIEEGKRLISSGFKVFPLHGIKENGNCTCYLGAECKSAGKHPIEKDWQSKAITTSEELEAACKKHPYMNIGVITGEDLIVVDVDPRHGGMESYEENKCYFPETLTIITGGDGLHLYYKKPEGAGTISNKTNIFPGIDIRGDGGLVVAPGSKHKSGKYYRVKED